MKDKVRVWDPLLRIFHWSLVLSFAVSYLSGESEGLLHVYSGYLILGLLGFRVLWGLVGSRYARFSQFLRPLSATKAYLRGLVSGRAPHYLGHNPAGGLMIVALLLSLSLTGLSGLKLYGLEGNGPLAAVEQPAAGVAEDARRDHDDDDEEGEEWWEEIHEFFANFTLLLVFVHVAGVGVSSLLHRENLVRAMLTGDKQRRDDSIG